MIDTKELRRGNLIQWDNDKNEIEIVNVIAEKAIGLKSDIESDLLSPIEFFKPIQITENLLIGSGFKKLKHYQKVRSGQSKFAFYKGLFCLNIEKYGNDTEFSFCYKSYRTTSFINGIHHMQNLMKDLFSMEFELKTK